MKQKAQLLFFFLTILAAQLGVLLPHPVQAQIFDQRDGAGNEDDEKPVLSFNAAILAEAIYDENVFLTKYNHEGDFYGVLQPKAGLTVNYDPFQLDLAYQPRFIFFTKNFGDNRLKDIAQDLNFSTILFATNNFELHLKDTLSMVKTDYSRTNTPSNLSLQNRVNPKAVFTYELFSRTTLDLAAEFERTDIEDPGQDYFSYGASFGINHELNQNFLLYNKVSSRRSHYDSPLVGKTFAISDELGTRFNFFERVTGNVAGLYDFLRYESGSSSAKNFGYKTGISIEVTETTTFNVDFRKTYGFDLTASRIEQSLVSGSIHQQVGNRTLLTAEGYYTLNKVPVVSPFTDRLWGSQGGVTYEINEHFKAHGRYEYDANVGPFVINDYTAHRGVLSLEYDFGPIINIF